MLEMVACGGRLTRTPPKLLRGRPSGDSLHILPGLQECLGDGQQHRDVARQVAEQPHLGSVTGGHQ